MSPGRFLFRAGMFARRVDSRMKAHTDSITVPTRGKGTYEITDEVARIVGASGVTTGLVTVFIQHTSASLVIYENADSSARADLHEFFERLVPEDEDYYIHTAEGSDDTTSHLRMILTRTSECVPVAQGRLTLGTWQGIFLFEHRRAPHRRSVVVSIVGV
jgi:secondary thiamine-phosphate synthase enzyme